MSAQRCLTSGLPLYFRMGNQSRQGVPTAEDEEMGQDINGWDSQGIKAGRSSENIRGACLYDIS
ncbi:hypothetical protein [Bacteroides caecigallinarum]|uniref:hypothetical protein n=1 Tax=Bacteroides caecigallinarum TaxID=1411144 RepID=UPI001F264003|nr:hypothetical protein [Bacteroides caecigallinarum]MCF2581294.1 hypothetical protein [Bacteroides caecigallinarum]